MNRRGFLRGLVGGATVVAAGAAASVAYFDMGRQQRDARWWRDRVRIIADRDCPPDRAYILRDGPYHITATTNFQTGEMLIIAPLGRIEQVEELLTIGAIDIGDARALLEASL